MSILSGMMMVSGGSGLEEEEEGEGEITRTGTCPMTVVQLDGSGSCYAGRWFRDGRYVPSLWDSLRTGMARRAGRRAGCPLAVGRG